MLRFLYRCALRLHPCVFRKRFAGEMLSIFDHSAGKLAAFSLLADALLSLARQWVLRPEFRHELSGPQQHAPDGIPSFSTLDPFLPRAGALIHGLVLSTAVFCLTCSAIEYSGIHVLHARIPKVQLETAPSMQTNPDSVGKDAVDRVSVSSRPQSQNSLGEQPTPGASAQRKLKFDQEPAKRSAFQTSLLSLPARSQPGAQQPEANSSTTNAEPIETMKLDAAERKRVVDGAITNLTKYYIYPDVAQKMADALLAYEKNGDDEAVTDGEAFANLLTRQMRDASHDAYVTLVFSTDTTPENPPAPTLDEVARYQKEMQQNNCTFEQVKLLPHNIGYLKFNRFPDTTVCGTTVAAAMGSLNYANAIIFDLRDNRGGYSNMVALVATYLFDHPTHLNDFYNRGDNSTEQSWTLPPVPGNRLADKLAFVLISHTTFSAAEGFSYDLKMSKRATLVGETTSGRGHVGMGHRIDDYFTIRVPGVRVVNPISKTNWEGTGVEPDVKVNAAEALETAVKLAESRLQQK